MWPRAVSTNVPTVEVVVVAVIVVVEAAAVVVAVEAAAVVVGGDLVGVAAVAAAVVVVVVVVVGGGPVVAVDGDRAAGGVAKSIQPPEPIETGNKNPQKSVGNQVCPRYSVTLLLVTGGIHKSAIKFVFLPDGYCKTSGPHQFEATVATSSNGTENSARGFKIGLKTSTTSWLLGRLPVGVVSGRLLRVTDVSTACTVVIFRVSSRII